MAYNAYNTGAGDYTDTGIKTGSLGQVLCVFWVGGLGPTPPKTQAERMSQAKNRRRINQLHYSDARNLLL